MPAAVMSFESILPVGRVMSVDTTRVFIHVDEHELLKVVMVGNLVAVQGTTGHQFLISIVERITRLPVDSIGPIAALEDEAGPHPVDLQDAIRAVLVGTYRSRDGDIGPSFRRGANSCPQIDQSCFLIQGTNLTAFMGVLSQGVASETALRLGHFAIDPIAQAVADGDRFFQRHAAILGSTGSGKSWTVAALLERANTLGHPNIVVLDMHGEYASLARGRVNGFTEYFKIAGPGDVLAPPKHTLFLPYWLLNREEMLSMLLDRSDVNAPNQATRFTSLVLEGKRRFLEGEGRKKVLASFTVDSPIPYDLPSLIDALRDDDQAMVAGSSTRDKQGPWYAKLTRFISRLDAKIADRRYGFLFKPPTESTTYEWLQQLADRSPTTIALYLDNFRRYILPKWGDTYIANVKAVQVERWLRSLSFAPSTKSKLRNQLSMLFSHAIRHEIYVGTNPISWSVRGQRG